MKSLMWITCAMVSVAMLTGCAAMKESWAKATAEPPPDTRDPMTRWVEDCSFAKVIEQKKAAGQTLSESDLRPEVKVNYAPLHSLADGAARLYLPVVLGVERLNTQMNGRQVYIGVQNDIAQGAKAESLFASMPAEDKAAYEAYAKLVAETDQQKEIDYASKIRNAQLEMTARVVLAVKEAKKDMKGLKKKEKWAVTAALLASSGSITDMLNSANEGIVLWQELLKKDQEAKAFMADYPIGK